LRGEPDVVMQGDRAVQQSRWSTSRGGQSGASAIYGKNSLLMNGRGCALVDTKSVEEEEEDQ